MVQVYKGSDVASQQLIDDLVIKGDALGVYLSGAGPTVMAIIKEENRDFLPNVSRVLNEKMKNWHLEILEADNQGAQVEIF